MLTTNDKQEIESIVSRVVDRAFTGHPRLDRMENHIDRMGGRLDGMGGRLDGMDSRLDGMDSRLDGMDSRLDRMEKRDGKMQRDINILVDTVESIDRRLHRLEASSSV